MDEHAKKRLIAALHRGELTIAEVAKAAKVSRTAVAKWILPAEAKRARAFFANEHAQALIRGKSDRAAQPLRPGAETQMRIVSQRNPDKIKILRSIKKGSLTIKEASKRTGIPISGIIGWMKLAKMPIPDEYNQPHRKTQEK